MGDKKKGVFNLTLICDGAMPEFVVDAETIEIIEKRFEGDDLIKFVDLEDNGEVKVRDRKIIGYKKAQSDSVSMDVKNNMKLAGMKKRKSEE